MSRHTDQSQGNTIQRITGNFPFKKTAALALLFSFMLAPLSVFADTEATTDTPPPAASIETPVDSGTSVTAETPTPEAAPSEEAPAADAAITPPPAALSGVVDPPPQQFYGELELVSNPDIDKATGAFTQDIPIKVPPGRNGLQPDLKITYNSQRTLNQNIIGYGWMLNIPYIQRLNRLGVDRMYTTDYFDSLMDGELASTSVSGATTTYMARVENGSFLKYEYNSGSNSWLVTDKNGTLYKFGFSTTTQQIDPAGTGKVYKWMLQEVRDTNNNFMRYEYFQDTGQIYPSKIFYTGTGVTDGVLEVNFLRESRGDNTVSYREGFAVKTGQRIKEIDTKVNGTLVRKYVLTYMTGHNFTRSLLASVTETGIDEGGISTSLPPTQFSYATTSSPGWTETGINTNNTEFKSDSTQSRIVIDVNGDGFTDLLTLQKSAATSTVQLNKGGLNGWDDGGNYNLPVLEYIESGTQGYAFSDINGDGYVDLIWQKFTGPVTHIYLNNKTNGWTETGDFQLTTTVSLTWDNTNGFAFADVNGDGLADYLSCYGGASNVYINGKSGAGWPDASSGVYTGLVCQFVQGGSSASKHILGDVNGDGLLDAIFTMTGPTQARLDLNDGASTWIETNTSPLASTTDLSYSFSGEINGDGLQDIEARDTPYISNASTSPTWPSTTLWSPPPISLSASNIFGDVNGDGLIDILYQNPGNNAKSVYINNGIPTDVLSKVTYPTYGSSIISYKNTPQFMNGSTILNPKLPTPLIVVSDIGINDNQGNIASTTYVYEGGELYATSTSADRRFAGFADIIQTDPTGNVTKTYFHQGNVSSSTIGEYLDTYSKIGKPYRIENYDSSGNLYKKVINKWDRYVQDTQRDFVKLAQTVVYTYDGNSDHKDSSDAYAYNDTNGNLTQKISYGDGTGSDDGTFVDSGTDKNTLNLSYATSSTSAVTGKVYDEVLNDNSGTKVSETRHYFDSLSLGSISLGNETKMEKWKSGSAYASTTQTYNPFGLIATSTDPLGKSTGYVYDSLNIYPATTTNPLSQKTAYKYDYSVGKPATTTDANGNIYATVFDGLDRVIQVKQPDPVTASTTVTTTAFSYSSSTPFLVRQTDYLNSATSTDTYRYFDGLGRLIQSRKTAEAGNFVEQDVTYNSRGLKATESLPYFVGSSAYGSATTTSALFTTYNYDALRRVSSAVNVIGTTQYGYDQWQTDITDPNGKHKQLKLDAFNRLIEVDEHNGGSTYTTTYNYDTLGDLTNIGDALSNTRNFTYDGLGRRLTAEDLHALGDTTYGTTTYAYDDASNLTSTVNPRNQTINFTYDALSRPLTEDYTGQAGTEITYTYDTCGNGKGWLCTASSTGAKYTYAYNPLGAVKTETAVIIGTSTNFTTQYIYDRQGNITQITYPDSAIVKYVYNTAGLLDLVQKKEASDASYSNLVSNFDYAPTSQMTTITYANGVTTTNTYNPAALYRLSGKISTLPTASRAQDLAYTYDVLGNITQIVDNSASATKKILDFSYDDLSRLLTASTTNATTSPNYKQTFAYDALGNMTSGPAGTSTYAGNTGGSYANPDAATQIVLTVGTSTATTTLTYDKSGNLASSSPWNYTWSYRNELTQAATGTATSTYSYDHNNIRVKTVEPNATTFFPNKFYNVTLSGTGTTTKHIFANDLLLATSEKVGASAPTTRTVLTDNVLGTSIVTNSSGAIVETEDFYPYGQTRFDTKTGGFVGERNKYAQTVSDYATGLNYARARYQNPVRGVFISEDASHLAMGNPSGLKQLTGQDQQTYLSDPQQLNSYSYARDNPITKSDPSGNSFNYGTFNTLGAPGAAQSYIAAAVNAQVQGYTNAVATFGVGVAALTTAGLASAAGIPVVATLTNPTVLGAAQGVAQRAYLDSQDGQMSDSAGQYAGAAVFGAATARVVEGRTLGQTLGITAGFSAVENKILDGSYNVKGIIANTLGAGTSKVLSLAAPVGAASQSISASLANLYRSVAELGVSLASYTAMSRNSNTSSQSSSSSGKKKP